MKVILAEKIGFCSGVRRAYRLIKNNYARYPAPVQILGPLVHNTQIIKELKEWGIIEILSPEQAAKGTVIIPSHGINPQTITALKAKKIKIINATCPKVSRVIAQAQTLQKQRKKILIFGDKNHSEVKAINEAINKQGVTFRNLLELQTILKSQQFKQKPKSFSLISQTTQNASTFKQIKAFLKKKYPQIEIFNTICQATYTRQKAVRKLTQKSDILLIIGSPISANSNRLYQICLQKNPRTYFVDKTSQIKKQWFKPRDTVGIGAGASTPKRTIKEAVRKIKNL